MSFCQFPKHFFWILQISINCIVSTHWSAWRPAQTQLLHCKPDSRRDIKTMNLSSICRKFSNTSWQWMACFALVLSSISEVLRKDKPKRYRYLTPSFYSLNISSFPPRHKMVISSNRYILISFQIHFAIKPFYKHSFSGWNQSGLFFFSPASRQWGSATFSANIIRWWWRLQASLLLSRGMCNVFTVNHVNSGDAYILPCTDWLQF